MYDEIMQKIKTLVNDENQVQEIFNLLSEEVFDNLFSQLADVSTDEELQVYENRINESKSPEHLQTILNEIAVTVYGENALQQLKEDYMALLSELEQNVKDAKDLMQRAQQGDQTAQDILNKAKQTDIYKSITEK